MARRRRNPEVIAGRVNADGSIAAGDGFTVQKTGTGTYVVTLASGFRLISATANSGGSPIIAHTVSYGERSFTITLLNPSSVATDQSASFTAVGVQQ